MPSRRLASLLPLALLACGGDKRDPAGDTGPDANLDTGPLAAADADGDGFPPGGDCDDADAAVNPDAAETCDGVDNDCDGQADEGLLGTFYADSDGDGYGDAASAVDACDPPDGYAEDDTDCDDTSAESSPAGAEICDERDNDCDGSVDEDPADAAAWHLDGDGDGYGDPDVTAEGCEPPAGYTADGTDCDDADPALHDACAAFPAFSGATGAAWETLARTSGDNHLYSLITYQASDIPYIYNMYPYYGQKYDPGTDTWTTLATVAPYFAPWATMAPWDGDLWMIRNNHVYSYDPPTDTWTTEAAISGGDDMNMTESDEDGVIYGHTSSGKIVAYDATTGAISYHPTGLGGLSETRMAYDPGTRAIFFGAYEDPALYRFDLATHAVSAVAPIPEGQLNDVFCSDRSGHIYAAGGTEGTTMYQYDVATDTWASIPDLPSDHGNNGSCTVSADGWLYVGAGSYYAFYRLPLY